MHLSRLRLKVFLIFLLALISSGVLGAAERAEPWMVKIAADGHHLELAYHGQVWISRLRVELTTGTQKQASDDASAKLTLAPAGHPRESVVVVEAKQSYEIVFRFQGPSVAVSLRGLTAREASAATVTADLNAGSEPLQARLEGVEDDVQQMESGRAASTLNDCVFDRFRDQALKVLARETRFTPTAAGYSVVTGGRLSDAPICGFELVERVYSKRLPFYAPLDKKEWPQAPAGWCSFHYYGGNPSERDILRNAEALARYYRPFGLNHVLLDGGWQAVLITDNWTAGKWTEANDRFPHGMKWLAESIKALGMKPGIWLSVFGTADESLYSAHENWFLHDQKGNAKLGTWFGTYVADFSNPEVERYLYQVYRKITVDWGYDYFKLDGENNTRDIWAQNRTRAFDPTLDADIAFRRTLTAIRQAMSLRPGVFFSACGPEYPTESMGIVQSARLGGDDIAFNGPNQDKDGVPSFWGVRTALEGMRRGFYTHNIAWYGDPDAVLVRPPLSDDEARTWVSILGLTGQLLMFGDDMPALPDDRRDLLRKILPVADITPMELYPAAADRHIWMLHIARPLGAWAVAGLFNWDNDGKELILGKDTNVYDIIRNNDKLLGMQRPQVDFMALGAFSAIAIAENQRLQALADKPAGLQLIPVTIYLTPPPPRHFSVQFDKVGLERSRDYLLFDFWNQKFLGKVQGQYSVELSPHACQVLSLRPAEGHPQLVGTDRHITMGAVELKDEKWDAARKQLRIKVELVENYPTTLTIYNAGRDFRQAKAVGADLQTSREGETVRVKLMSPRSGVAEVTLRFE
jgi:hypothetical protein